MNILRTDDIIDSDVIQNIVISSTSSFVAFLQCYLFDEVVIISVSKSLSLCIDDGATSFLTRR